MVIVAIILATLPMVHLMVHILALVIHGVLVVHMAQAKKVLMDMVTIITFMVRNLSPTPEAITTLEHMYLKPRHLELILKTVAKFITSMYKEARD